MKNPARALMVFTVAAVAFSVGCSLITADFEGDVRVRVDFFEENDNSYSGVVTVDPNDYDEYEDNIDRIKDGELLGIDIAFIDVPLVNEASVATGQVDVRRAESNDEFTPAVGVWNGVQIVTGNSFPADLSPDGIAVVKDILFSDNAGPIELRIVGNTDTATISFTTEVTVRFKFTAGI